MKQIAMNWQPRDVVECAEQTALTVCSTELLSKYLKKILKFAVSKAHKKVLSAIFYPKRYSYSTQAWLIVK
jgi:hypothetical protein